MKWKGMANMGERRGAIRYGNSGWCNKTQMKDMLTA